MPAARQSVQLATLLGSVQRCLELSLATIPVARHLIQHWISDDRPRFEADDVLVTYRLRQQVPTVKYAGANRLGFMADQILSVAGYVRQASDKAGGDRLLMAGAGRVNFYGLMAKIIDTFQGLNLFSAYADSWTPNEPAAGVADGATLLTIIPNQMVQVDPPSKPKADPGWAVGQVEFEVRLVQPLQF